MKIVSISVALAAVGLGAAIENQTDSRHAAAISAIPRGCVAPDAATPVYRQRANLIVLNAGRQPLRIRLDPRAGTGLPATDLGRVGAGETKVFAGALPAGRNKLTAIGDDGLLWRRHYDVVNRGAETCTRRHVWPVQ